MIHADDQLTNLLARRSFIGRSSALGGLIFSVGLGSSMLAQEQRSLLVSTEKKQPQLALRKATTRVKSVLEVRGEVRLRSTTGTTSDSQQSAVRRAPVESKTTLQYEEVFEPITNNSREKFSALYFEVAESGITIEKHATDKKLRDQSQRMIRWTNAGQNVSKTAAIGEPLTEAEYKLSESPVVSMYLDLIAPPSSQAIGEKYLLDENDVAKLFSLDVVTGGTLSSVIIDQDENEQTLEVVGQFSAAVNSVPTRIELTGKARVNRATGLVTYFAASIEEEREVGFAEPGFKITARLRLIREQVEAPKEIGKLDEYRALLADRQQVALQQFESHVAGYQFLADVNWVVYKDSEVDTILRYVKQNRVLANCNIINLADMEPGRQLTIDGFLTDVRRSLGKGYGQVLEQSETLTKNKLRMMKIVVGGQIEGINVQWINLLISNDEGRHVSVVYTFNSEYADAVQGSDSQFADSFTFTRRLKTAEELAEQDQSAKKQ